MAANIESDKKLNEKRPETEILAEDDYFMGIAFLTAMRSEDPNSQVGACIVNKRNRIVGIGYNGMPEKCKTKFPWKRNIEEFGWRQTKYPYVCHAQMNAILNKNSASLNGCRIYVSLFPCNECAKLIIQSGITEVIYYSEKNMNQESTIASKELFEQASGVKFHQHRPENILVDFSVIEQSVAEEDGHDEDEKMES